ncbi:peptidase M16 [Taibaiella sp. KBW10]|uniref:insulinase family protein n=1 Tax=Taibaiella sp. KBW10 TaxID=2153357 RepID=UPI000F59FE4F|nr:insulinase family protein [Taibaiella sp. KBW10]RQO31871.1 peptidase M16 [Taibaiella sp. KBW10]
MKKITLSIAALALFSASFAQNLDRSIRPKPGPAPEIKLGDAQSFTLPNGLKVFVVENHKLPTVSYSIQLNIDPLEDPAKSGLGDFIGSLITAGTKTMPKEKFDEATDMIGATLQASSGGIFGNSMTKHQDVLLKLMSDALMNADFQQSELDKLKKQALAGLEQAKNEPDQMLENVTNVLNYGKAHPYGIVTTEKTVGNVTLADCKSYYTTYFRPNVAYMAVVGDITLKEAQTLVTKYFGKWEKATVPSITYPKVAAPTKTTVDFVPRDNAVQSVVGVTYPIDLKPGTPDVIKVRMLNEILGGSGTGRLFLNLREKHGWTYGAYSSFKNDKEVGEFQAYAKARNVVTDSSVNEIMEEMKRIRNEKVDAATLQDMKNYVTGTFAIGLESPQTIAQYAINIERYKMPKDYYKNYLKNVAAVSVDDIQSTAKKYVNPDAAHILVVGDKAEADKLKRFAADGVVHYYDNYGNTVEAPVVKAVAADVTPQSVIAKYIDAIGGKAAMEGLKSLVTEGAAEAQGQQIKIVQKVVSPDKYLMSVVVPGMGEVQKITVSGTSGKMSSMGQSQDVPADMLGSFLEQADLQADLHPEKYGIKMSMKGVEKVEGADCYVVEKVSDKGSKSVSYYDQKTNLLLKEVKTDASGTTQTTLFSDYKAVTGGNGYKAPYGIKIQSAQGTQELKVVKMEANKTVSDSEFK